MFNHLRAAVCLAAVATAFGAEIAGHWEGTVAIPAQEMRLVIDLAQDRDGNWKGSATIPGFGIKGAQLIDIAVNGSGVSFAIKGVLGNPKLTGHFSPAGTLSGAYSQAGNTAEFVMNNSGPAQVDPPRRSTAIDKELEGAWEGEISYAGKPLRIRLRLANKDDGTSTGELVVMGPRETKFPLELITQEAGMLSLEMADGGIKWEGRFQRAPKELNGVFTQGISASVVFRPVAETPAAPHGGPGA